MYYLCTLADTVRVSPDKFGGDLKKTVLEILQKEYEGLLDEDLGIVTVIVEVNDLGDGKVVPGDGAAYYDATFKTLVYKPEIQEVVEGIVSEITEFGAFVRIGPLEGLVHVSQIMDDYINYDPKLPGFVGRDSGRKLTLNDTVLTRIVTVSLKGSIQSSKIGLTMRQDGLGKPDWPKFEVKKKEKVVTATAKNPKTPKQPADRKPQKK